MEISYEELCELIKQEMEDEWREMLEDERGGVSERTKPIQWNRWYRLSM